MKRYIHLTAMLALAAPAPILAQPQTTEPDRQIAAIEPPRIQLAILLDTSNSMDGLIHQAATLQGQAGVDSCRDAPAFPGERGRFRRLNDEGSGRLRQMAASICRHQLALSRFQLAPTISLLT